MLPSTGIFLKYQLSKIQFFFIIGFCLEKFIISRFQGSILKLEIHIDINVGTFQYRKVPTLLKKKKMAFAKEGNLAT